MNKQMTYDKQETPIPYTLKSTQEWFASIIANRMNEDSTIHSIAPDGMLIAEEAARYVVPSSSLPPHLRMQIYNQQYWWRLLKTLHENFPLVTRLFGYHAFNETIGIPYLLKYPPNHWSLTLLGERLSKWIAEEYHAPDKPLIQNAAQLDWAFMASFIAPLFPALNVGHLDQGNLEQLLSYTFYLQSHIFLFKWDYDLLAFREIFLQHDVDYWTENNFPSLPKGKTYHFVLYRSTKNYINWKEVSFAEYLLLETFKQGSSMEAACEIIERQESAIYEQAAQHLQKWLQDWVSRGWLILEKPDEIIS